MPSIEIEYPLSNAQVSLSFPAGGTYDLNNFRPELLVTDITTIRCRLYGGLPEAMICESGDALAPPASGSWSVMLNVPPGSSGSYTNCTLKAYFVVNGVVQEPPKHTVPGIGTSNQTGGSLDTIGVP